MTFSFGSCYTCNARFIIIYVLYHRPMAFSTQNKHIITISNILENTFFSGGGGRGLEVFFSYFMLFPTFLITNILGSGGCFFFQI